MLYAYCLFSLLIGASLGAVGGKARDVTDEIMQLWLPDQLALPSIDELSAFLNQPLSERAKIPLTDDRFNDLISNREYRNRSTRRDVEQLFRISKDETSKFLEHLAYSAVCRSPPDSSATENTFISFWDRNIRDIVELMVDGGKSIRDSNLHTSTIAKCPDFGFLYRNICALRGEEKSPTNPADPKVELSDKLIWTYDPAPYILGETFPPKSS